MSDVKELLERIKASPYEEVPIVAPHTGVVRFSLQEDNAEVHGPLGTWKEKPGTLIAHLEREGNAKPIFASQKGVVNQLAMDTEGTFVQAGERLATLRHYLTRDEVIEVILKEALELFNAPEKAAYYFTPELDSKVKSGGAKSVTLVPGQEAFIMSRMKREASLAYEGPEGQIYAVYFKAGQSVDAGQPLVGVCPAGQLDRIQEVVAQVNSEWKEG